MANKRQRQSRKAYQRDAKINHGKRTGLKPIEGMVVGPTQTVYSGHAGNRAGR